MDREVNIELARFRSFSQYKPRPGDFIIRHGSVFSTKWYGVINYIDKDGMLHIVKRGHPKILFMTTPDQIPSNLLILPVYKITSSVNGQYSVMQQDLQSNIPVWYV